MLEKISPQSEEYKRELWVKKHYAEDLEVARSWGHDFVTWIEGCEQDVVQLNELENSFDGLNEEERIGSFDRKVCEMMVVLCRVCSE